MKNYGFEKKNHVFFAVFLNASKVLQFCKYLWLGRNKTLKSMGLQPVFIEKKKIEVNKITTFL